VKKYYADLGRKSEEEDELVVEPLSLRKESEDGYFLAGLDWKCLKWKALSRSVAEIKLPR
jgi:hypothetical protein